MNCTALCLQRQPSPSLGAAQRAAATAAAVRAQLQEEREQQLAMMGTGRRHMSANLNNANLVEVLLCKSENVCWSEASRGTAG